MDLAVALNDPLFYISLPALPALSHAEIATRIVTHPSYNGERTQSFEFVEGGGRDYRRDALRGDSLLKGFVTELLYEMYPRLTPGAATIILSAVWSNSTLAKLGEAYGLHRALRAAQPQRASLQMNGDVKASLFEARVYGIQLASGEDNYKTIKAFIKELFSPILTAQRAAFAAGDASQAQVMRADNFVDYVSLLNLWSQRFAKRIEYRSVESWGPAHCPQFSITVYVNNVPKGTGQGYTVKEARQE